MPLYEYKCKECGRELTLLQKFDDPPPVCVCKDGDLPTMERQLSLGSFRLKGTGWYLTDYAGKKKVIVVSPTSFLAYLQTVLQGMKNQKISEQAQMIIKEVERLGGKYSTPHEAAKFLRAMDKKAQA